MNPDEFTQKKNAKDECTQKISFVFTILILRPALITVRLTLFIHSHLNKRSV